LLFSRAYALLAGWIADWLHAVFELFLSLPLSALIRLLFVPPPDF
jgi:hypothetical protein